MPARELAGGFRIKDALTADLSTTRDGKPELPARVGVDTGRVFRDRNLGP